MSEEKSKIELSVVDIANVSAPKFSESITSGRDWVNYGNDNQFPKYLWDRYVSCPIHQSVIDGLCEYIMGDGINHNFPEKVNRDGETIEEVLSKCILDWRIYGGFSMQVIYNAIGEATDILWVDFSKIRTSEDNKRIFFFKDWSRRNVKPTEFRPINHNEEGKTTQVFYYKGSKARNTYPIPSYTSALDSIETASEIQSYHLNAITNNFCDNTVINFNNGIPDEAKRIQIEEKINNKFSGAKNAGRVLISFNENKDASTTIDKVPSDNQDKRYAQLKSDTDQNIFIAHRVTSPCLFGVIAEGQGFSKTEYTEAFAIFNKTVVAPAQKEFVAAIKKVLPEFSLEFVPFTIPKFD